MLTAHSKDRILNVLRSMKCITNINFMCFSLFYKSGY